MRESRSGVRLGQVGYVVYGLESTFESGALQYFYNLQAR